MLAGLKAILHRPKVRAVLRTAAQGFLAGATLAVTQSQFTLASGLNVTFLRGLVASALIGGVAAAWSAVHNFVLDPSPLPSAELPAAPPPAP